MAKKEQAQLSSGNTNTFIKGLNKDSDPMFVQEGMWTHARNVTNNTAEGDLATLSNEESNALCAIAGETMFSNFKYVIGAIHLFSDKWIIYSVAYDISNTKSINSEIGLFESDQCIYRPIVQDPCLNFSKLNLITGASKLSDNCTWQVYWADGLNPDRYLNVGDPKTWPSSSYTWMGTVADINYYTNTIDKILWPGVAWNTYCPPATCTICVDINSLNCDKIRLASLVKTPCVDIALSNQAGVIENGSYAICVAYVIDRFRVTNYFSPSYIQPLFNTVNERGSFEITIDADSVNFEEMELVIIRFIDQNLSAKRIGYYSTKLTSITLDQISETLTTVPAELIILQDQVFEKSNQMSEVNNYLLRIGPTSKFDFNYQPLANLIETEWVSIEYPETYYVDGGKNTSYLRDEVYSFFIRWVYNTGDKSSSYHIPGRPATSYTYAGINYPKETDTFLNVSGVTLQGDTQLFQSINTATITSLTQSTLPDGGVVLARGKMGYWQSTEAYPDFQANVWNSSSQCWTATTDPNYDLCGQYIRHHKFPDNALSSQTYHFRQDATTGEFFIRLMGIDFKNIIYPKDNDGYDIPGIVGYEILRGSRHGNKSILAKGMINNFKTFEERGSAANSGNTPLYANYPFNCLIPEQNNINNGTLNNYLFNDPFISVRDIDDNKVNQTVPSDIVSFHSPDTSFINPYLSTSELKIYGSLQGQALQYFIEPEKHPKARLLNDKVIPFALATGVIYALLKAIGELKINYPAGNLTVVNDNLVAGPPGLISVVPSTTVGFSQTMAANSADGGLNLALNSYIGTSAAVLAGITGVDPVPGYFVASQQTLSGGAGTYTLPTYDKTYTGYQMLGPVIQTGSGQILFFFIEGCQLAVETIYAIVRKRQYALELVGHGDYYNFVPPVSQFASRFSMESGQYVSDQLQAMPEFLNSSGNLVKYKINNVKRPKLVVVRTISGDTAGTTAGPHFLLNSNGKSIDSTSMTLGHAIRTFNPLAMIPLGSSLTPNKVNWKETGKINNFINPVASHYVGLKYRVENQYGQLDTIQQVVTTPCEQKIDFTATTGTNALIPTIISGLCNISGFSQNKLSTPVFLGGDTYINRFTEKNIMNLFFDWLYDLPDDFEWNYFINQMIPQPRFMINNQRWDISDFNIQNVLALFSNNPNYGEGLLPSSYYDLDNLFYNLATNLTLLYPGTFGVANSYFYTSVNGVRDFFVESDVLVDARNNGTFPWQQFYSKYNYTDLNSLFSSDPLVLSKGNYYAYDYTLSVSRFLFNQYFTAGVLQGVTYNPDVAALCYVSYPNKINYSLQQTTDDANDAWRIFLPLNEVNYKSKLSSAKNFAKTGLFLTFENDSPLIIQGVDTLELDDSGTKVTVGDGGLFDQPPQNVVVSEKPYEYGSSQSKYGVISTPAGLYFISQNQGKIFAYKDGIKEISQTGLKWWFNLFLPSQLLKIFPDYPHIDNPVAGIGCSASYDNTNSILYFSKKDYKVKDQYINNISYDSTNDNFVISQNQTSYTFKIGDPLIFHDASWTVSYDPKMDIWLSFHDWHPNLYIPSKGNFITTKDNTLWKHGAFCNDYCNFYGIQYPFEIEIPVITPQVVNTIKSIEYYLECYKRDLDLCVDQFHVLDYNFDHLVIYNSEQVSGYLNLNIYPKNDISLSLSFPKLSSNFASYDILYSKEEQKYRVNQFWDITKERGEFPINSDYPPNGGPYFPNPNSTVLLGNYLQQNIWITEPNGYIKNLNQLNLNYSKPDFQRKKFRNYINFIKLSKIDSRDTNMILKLLNTKTQYSPR
jgi:hypothetical protein